MSAFANVCEDDEKIEDLLPCCDFPYLLAFVQIPELIVLGLCTFAPALHSGSVATTAVVKFETCA